MGGFILECKYCGGEIECEEGAQVETCKFCGSLNTVATSGGKAANIYNRATYLRRNNEFDKAIEVYEEILNENNNEAEAHFGIVLCKYGIEYVEDPISGERVPTCHRTQFDSIFADANYKAAIEYGINGASEIYEKEAIKIDKIQKGILELVKNQESYDIFICYKESDNNGERTKDSVIAQELYYELTKRGYKVFFARKTLEGKLGNEYEPIIFAALNSAKVMVVLGTNKDYFNAVWVKNEWSRYRKRIKEKNEGIIIPAYKDMSPYDLPAEFLRLQALDMSKIGFLQELCDGIDKIVKDSNDDKTKGYSSIKPLLKRGFLFLEEGDFQRANEYFERVLDQEPEVGRAYWGKLMAELGIRNEENLIELDTPLESYANYNNALRFASDEDKVKYEGYNNSIVDKINKIEAEQAKFIAIDRIVDERKFEEKLIEYNEKREQVEIKKLKKKLIIIILLMILTLIIIAFGLKLYLS